MFVQRVQSEYLDLGVSPYSPSSLSFPHCFPPAAPVHSITLSSRILILHLLLSRKLPFLAYPKLALPAGASSITGL